MRWFWKHRRTRERDLERELENHVALEAEDRAGDIAAARRALGNITMIRENTRAEWVGAALNSLMHELRVTVRGLVRRPVFALSVVLTLGLGVGATTTIYSIVDGVLFRPLPYDEPETLVTVGLLNVTDPWIDGSANLQNLSFISFPEFAALKERARSFVALAAIQVNRSVLSDVGSGPEAVQVAGVSPDLFRLLDVVPVAGRSFLSEEYSIAAERVAVITYDTWQQRYGGRSDLFNRPIERLPAWTLVGVLPPEFRPPEVFFPDEVPEFWTPLPLDDVRRHSDPRGRLHVLGRLSPGASVEDARQETGHIASLLEVQRFVDVDGSTSPIGVNSLHAHTVGTSRTALTIFLAASGMLLLLAMMNASTILLVRSLDGRRELGVRMALGASRMRVVRSILVESGILSILGGGLGIAFAYGSVGVFLAYAPSSIPRLDSVAVDTRILGAAAAISLMAGMTAGILPAVRQSSGVPAEHINKAAYSSSEAAGIRGMLLVGQIAVAVVLLSGAGLLIGSFVRVQAIDPGFEPDDLIAMDVSIGAFARAVPDRFTSVPAAWERALEELRAVPGVESVAGTSAVPFQSSAWRPGVRTPGGSSDATRGGVTGYAVTPGFMETMGIGLLRGRDFERTDTSESESVAIVNENFVRTELAGREPLDAFFVRLEDAPGSGGGFVEVPTRIIGVVEDVVQARVEDGARPAIYVPYTQHPSELRAVVRTRLPAGTIIPELRRAAARFNPLFPVENVRTLSDRWDLTFRSPRFQSLVISAFAGVAILLAALGLYGFLAYSVRCRERELAIRAALGARRSSVVLMILKQGLGLSLAGLAIGMMATPVLTRSLATMLFDLEPGDPLTLVAAGGVLVAVSIAACLIPIRRATAVDPVTVLRAE